MPEQACVEELRRSKEWLEDLIGEQVRYMAASGGYINARIMQLTRRYGYVLTGICNEWMNSPETMTLPSKVSRVNIRRHFSMHDFRHVIKGFPGLE